MNKKWEGCRSSHTLSNAICEQAPPLQCPSADVFNTLDNNQKISSVVNEAIRTNSIFFRKRF